MPSKYQKKQADKAPKQSGQTTNEAPSCTSGKIRYDTQYEAEKAILLQTRPDVPTLYTYFCIQCFGFHWTSKRPNP